MHFTPSRLTPSNYTCSHCACSAVHAHTGACLIVQILTTMGYCACLHCTSLHHASSDWAGSTGMPTPFMLNCACSHCACLHLACSHRPCSYPCPRYECLHSACPRYVYYTCQVYSQVVSPCSIISAAMSNNLYHYVQLTVCARFSTSLSLSEAVCITWPTTCSFVQLSEPLSVPPSGTVSAPCPVCAIK